MDKEIFLAWMDEGTLQIPQILLKNYTKLGLNETDLVLLLHVYSFIQRGNEFPTPEELSGDMNISGGECSSILRRMVQQNILCIEEGYTEDSIRYEKYSLKPLWLKLADMIANDLKNDRMQKDLHDESELYTVFEKEFGRPLSPLECETLAMWMDQDHHDSVIIKAALRESVISGKLNFRYIDRILFEWKKNGVQTIEQARRHGEKFRQPKKANSEYQKSNTVPFYNWLEQ
ncbi:DnaD domain-containing protein [Falsibacillus albus]|uniref:DnaD domain protein n=1 Tax=Falsibacillus albus TaxID=2478915 RepID=A0A3L7K347_9BACI|nr:DnaD domain-containing protein [Falsibacillus albus]RLQ95132.1 DnaD domain protein [Falsibacillus albus]